MRVVLSVSTSDSSGGAGIQGDIKTLQAHGTYGASVIVGVLAESTVSIRSALPMPPEHVMAQFVAVCDDLSIDAVKIGALPSAPHVHCVTEAIRSYGLRNVVVDPTIFSSGGDALSDRSVIGPLRAHLFPLASCVCPNRLELGQHFGTEPLLEDDEAIGAARQLIAEGAGAVLVTGGYEHGPEASDVLVTSSEVVFMTTPRSRSRHVHGAGCALTTMIAAGLAHGLPLREAVETGKAFVTAAIGAGSALMIGQGTGPIDHGVQLSGSTTLLRSRARSSRCRQQDAL